MPRLRSREIDIYFEEAGEGAPIIVLHGALGSVEMTAMGLRPIDLAPHGFRVIAYDARGHGRSGFLTSPASYRRECRGDELLSFMDALGIEAAHLLGTSMGGGTALTVARREPERVKRLVLRSPSPFPADIAPARRALSAAAMSYRVLGTRITAELAGLASPASQRARTTRLFASQRREAAVPMLHGVLSESLYGDGLADVRTPVLIVAHRGDPLHPESSAHRLRAALPCATLVVGESRQYWDEHPDLLGSTIATFLRGTNSKV